LLCRRVRLMACDVRRPHDHIVEDGGARVAGTETYRALVLHESRVPIPRAGGRRQTLRPNGFRLGIDRLRAGQDGEADDGRWNETGQGCQAPLAGE
jgi:hypothetical protein